MEKIIKYTTLLYALLFFLGYGITYIYYKTFNINITEFFSTTEILLLFLDILLQNIFYIFYIIFFIFFLKLLTSLFVKRRFTSIIWKLIFLVIWAIAFAGAFIAVITINKEYLVRESYYFTVPWLLLFMISSGLLLLILFRNSTGVSERKMKKIFSKYKDELCLICTLSLITLMVCFIKIYDISVIKNDSKKSKYIISFVYWENEFIETNKGIKYLGSSNDYIFLYDLDNYESKIYERKNISNLKISRNK